MLTAVPGSASGATTIGQLAPPNPPITCVAGPFDFVQQSITSGASYVVPGVGRISSWSHNAGASTGALTMKIFRPLGGAVYAVVGHDGPRPMTASSLNTFATSISVQPGDVLGLNNQTGTTACSFDAPPDSKRIRGGDLSDGEAGEFANTSPGRLNVSAVFEPTATSTCKGREVTLQGTQGNDQMTGTPGPDIIASLEGKDKVSGLGGKDIICGGIGKDTLNGGKGKDRLLGQKGADTLKGGGGNDTCKGGKGRDVEKSC